MSEEILWLAIGFLSIIFEMLALPGFGFLFVGLGALSLSIILFAGYLLDFSQAEHVGFFLILTISWFGLLYFPLKSSGDKKKSKIIDVLGDIVIIDIIDLKPGEIGKVKWSGALFNARLNDDITEIAKIGSQMIIVKIDGNCLILAHKTDSNIY